MLGLQAVFHAHLQDLEVGPDHRHLAAEVARPPASASRIVGIDARSSAIRFFCIWLARGGSVSIRWSIDGQRVEQEVRLDLRLHRRHARLDHLALELLGLGGLGGLRRLRLGLDRALVGDLQDRRGDDPQKGEVGQRVAEVRGADALAHAGAVARRLGARRARPRRRRARPRPRPWRPLRSRRRWRGALPRTASRTASLVAPGGSRISTDGESRRRRRAGRRRGARAAAAAPSV